MTLELISQEILLGYILPNLSISDICSVSKTSTSLNQVVTKHGNLLWKKKFHQRWPKLVHILEHGGKENWLTCTRFQYHIEQQIHTSINAMIENSSIHRPPTSESMAVLNLKVPFEFLEDAVLKVANSKQQSTTSLTKTYYAKYLLRFLRCQRLDIEIQEYKENEKIGFAKGAFLVSKWQHVAENIIPQWEDVSCILEDTTTRIQNILQTRKNSKRPRRTLSEKEQTKEKVEITVHMLFQECNFHCDLLADSDKEDWNEILQAYYITEVLKNRRGKPIIIAIILDDILNRLDLKSEILSHENQFYVRVPLNKTTDTEWIFIDVSNHSVFPSRQLFPDEYPAEDHAIFFDIILPLYNIASEVHDTNFIKKEALTTISKEQLSNFHLNFSRFACCWEPDFLQPFKYAIACMTYNAFLSYRRQSWE
ncbi:hypothetical protein DAPPUDRAFT_119753 [Daphnia pulex]|uniref:Protein SirB1 N-terminal domain-containing protein n=1 Tax=Daphnia pulex TaxID=6669 RepID=E9HZD6_DAPPU|nr:hypothetical protein DAPPUDRAFT_119753 [Daphnia pulex]|eukprot:EFX62895.1 hypothetical protein DAPPUDRAFT_119753 [Daphnia pulex]